MECSSESGERIGYEGEVPGWDFVAACHGNRPMVTCFFVIPIPFRPKGESAWSLQQQIPHGFAVRKGNAGRAFGNPSRNAVYSTTSEDYS